MDMDKHKILKIGGEILAIVLVVGVVYKVGFASKNDAVDMPNEAQGATAEAIVVPTEMVGGQFEGTEDLGISWPGEIVSLGDLEVQPQREGVVVEWKTNIGQKVFQGQVLGKLSAPPKTPELIQMLAEQAEGLAKAKGQSRATNDFVKKNIEQLSTLRDALQKNIVAVNATLDGSAKAKNNTLTPSRTALEQLQGVVMAKRQNLRETIEQMLNKQILQHTNTYNPQYFRNGSLRNEFGGLSNSTRHNYEILVFDLVNELKDPEVLPTTTAKKYAQAAVNLLNTTADIETLPQPLDDLQKMANEDQINLLSAIKEYEEAGSDLAMQEVEYTLTYLEQEKDYAQQLKEINEKIAMQEREQQMALVEVQAAEAAYFTVASSITGGLNIVAPQAGVVSAIYKKNGDFVEPGMSVASINTNNTSQRFVRFYIPSNLPIPEPNTRFTITRPGYPKDGKKVELIGIGTALDANGAYVADARFIDPVDWPVRISVRVMPPPGSTVATLIPFAAVWWDDDAQANVWLVTEEGKIRPQPIKTGRILGDRIEVAEGLQKGNRYVAKVIDGLVRGMDLKDVKPAENQVAEKQSPHGDDPMGH